MNRRDFETHVMVVCVPYKRLHRQASLVIINLGQTAMDPSKSTLKATGPLPSYTQPFCILFHGIYGPLRKPWVTG